MPEVTTHRFLDLADEARPHLAAASGLVRVGRWAYVVADDELGLGVFALDDPRPGRLLPLFDGELPREPAPRKAAKPDLEVLLRLPADPAWPHGALLALGSGSRPNRERGALLVLDADGSARGPARAVDATSMFATLRAAWPSLNLEGVALQGDTLWCGARASRDEPRNALLGLPYEPLRASLRDGALVATSPPEIRIVALERVDGVAFGITDLSALPDGRFAFCAVTEDSRDSYEDGPCAAAALGVLSPQGLLEAFARIDPPHKIEGLDVEPVGDGWRCWLVTDADDATRPAQLLSTHLPWRRA